MAVEDFFEEMKEEKSKSTPAEKEIHKIATKIYNTLEEGEIKKSVRRMIVKLVKSINPGLNDTEINEAGLCIEAIIMAFFCEFIRAGELFIKTEEEGGGQRFVYKG